MKLTFTSSVQLLTLVFLTFVITLAHANTSFSNDTIYTVQLGTFKSASQADFKDLKPIGYVFAENMAQDNRMAVFLSNYDTKKEANKALAQVRKKGYDDAFISDRPLSKGETVYVVQLGTQNSNDNIDWESYARAGQVYTLLNGTSIKVTTSPYNDMGKAKQRMEFLRKLGFIDAFVKPVNTLQLHKVTEFDTGGKKINFSPVAVPADPPIADGNTQQDAAPNSGSLAPVDANSGVADNSSSSFDLFFPKEPTNISKQERRSVKEFQSYLKKQSAYSGSVDGVYGKGTAKGIEMMEQTSTRMGKYRILAGEAAKSVGSEDEITQVEAVIFSIPNNPKEAYAALEQEKSPIAKAYQAYILFDSDQNKYQTKINGLMNNAIKTAYNPSTYKGKPPFDPSATYSYTKLDQLILHTRYIQAALNYEPATPCWLFVRHKDEAYRAFNKAADNGAGNFRMQNCRGFSQWESILMLKVIASDLNPSESPLTDKQKKQERQYSTRANRLYLIPRVLTATETDAVKKWNDKLIANIDKRMETDAFFAKFAEAFKIAYYKAWIQLEDFYLEKGFSKTESEALALAVLQSMIGTDMESYAK